MNEAGKVVIVMTCGSLVYYHCAFRNSSLLSLLSDVLIVLLCSLAILGLLFRQLNISSVLSLHNIKHSRFSLLYHTLIASDWSGYPWIRWSGRSLRTLQIPLRRPWPILWVLPSPSSGLLQLVMTSASFLRYHHHFNFNYLCHLLAVTVFLMHLRHLFIQVCVSEYI